MLTTVANGRFLNETNIDTKAIKPTRHLFKCEDGPICFVKIYKSIFRDEK